MPRSFSYWLVFLFLVSPTTALALDIAAWEDPGGSAGIDEIAAPNAAERFVPLPEDRFEKRSSTSAWWFRIHVPANLGDQVLYLDGNWLDHVDLYQRGPSGWLEAKSGDVMPVSTRPIRTTSFAFPLASSVQDEPVYVRIASEGILRTQFELFERTAFLERQNRNDWIVGLYLTFLFTLVLYHLLLFIGVRDTSYLGYVLFLGSILIFHACSSGHAALWFWPELPAWGSVASSVVAPFALTGVLILTWHFSEAHTQPRWIQRGFWILGGIYLSLPILVLIHFRLSLAVGVPIGAFIGVSTLVPIGVALRRGSPLATYLVAAWLALTPAMLVWQASFMGLLAPNFWTQYSLHLGIIVQALIFSFALAARIRMTQDQRFEAEQALAESRRSLAGQLLEAQDGERKRIAGQLHDGLGQPLLVLSNRLERRLAGEEGGQELVELSRHAIDDIRRISRGLHPHRLELMGFADAVRELVDESFVDSGIRPELHLEVVAALPRSAELHLYRILQEAFSNVLRHSNATSVRIGVSSEKDALELTVEDDGRPGVANPSGIGTASISARARALGGHARFLTSPNGGMRLEIRT